MQSSMNRSKSNPTSRTRLKTNGVTASVPVLSKRSYARHPSAIPEEDPGRGEQLSRLELESKIYGTALYEDTEVETFGPIPQATSSHRSVHSDSNDSIGFCCTPVLILTILVNLVSLALIILTSIVIAKDSQWNGIINGKESFPPLSTSQSFFSSKTLRLDKLVNQGKRDELIRRDLLMPSTYIGIMVNFLLVSFLYAIISYSDVLHSWTEGSRCTSGVYIFLGLISIGACVIMNHFTIQAYEDKANKASELFFNSKLSEAQGNPHKRLSLRNDEEIIGTILTLCAYYSTQLHFNKQVHSNRHTLSKDLRPVIDLSSHSIQIHLLPSNITETYSVQDLATLGFCRDPAITSSIYILSIILFIICWAIPVLNAIRGVYCEKWVKKDRPRPEPHKVMVQTDKWTHQEQPQVKHSEQSNALDANRSSRAKIHPPEAYD